MKKLPFLFASLLLLSTHLFAQAPTENILYIIDSIVVKENPEEGDDVFETDIADLTVIKNKDTLKLLGLEKFSGVIYIFTKEYRKRPEDIKQIPSSKQMERKEGAWFYRGSLYSGKFIDYYYSGKKQGEGILQNGRLEGLRTIYYQTGQPVLERYYSNGIENGLEKEYYEDGSIKQKGGFVSGKEDGVWEMYFPNGQVKQRSTFKTGTMEGETIIYYSTGKIYAVELTRNGKTTPDKRLEKINQFMNKGHNSYKEGDNKAAIKNYTKVIELDSSYAEAYFSRGTVKLNEFKFDEAILDFDKALLYEPYMENALTNRAFARIRKHQFGSSRLLSKNSGVTVMASKDNSDIPENELAMICTDFKKAIFLGDRNKMVMEAVAEFCESKKK